MTKNQLEIENERLKKQLAMKEEELHRADNAIEYYADEVDRLTEELIKLRDDSVYIKNWEHFISRMKSDGYFSEEINTWFKEYMRYYND